MTFFENQLILYGQKSAEWGLLFTACDFRFLAFQDQDQDSYWWNAETTITHQDLWLGN